ncbi:ssk1 response regulator receiver, partial [Ascosphaera atra]
FRKPSGPVAIQAYRALQEREKRRLKNQSSYSLSADEAEPLSRAVHKPSASTPLQSKGSVNALLLAHSNSPSSPVVLPPLAGHIRKPSIPPAQEQRPSIAERRKCVLPPFNQHLSIPSSIRSNREISQEEVTDSYPPSSISGSGREMPRRKVWVQRAGSSATLVAVAEDDLVDDLRDAILRKYANSLGRTFDAPDLGIRLVPRKSSAVRASITDRLLGPEEHILSTLDKYYPGGQTVEDALIIDVPQRRTPRPSPRHVYYTSEEVMRPAEGGEEYFPPVSQPPPPAGPPNGLIHHAHTPPVPAMSILTTGQAPNVPSPPSFPHPHRPRVARTHTHTPSPTILPPQPTSSLASAPKSHVSCEFPCREPASVYRRTNLSANTTSPATSYTIYRWHRVSAPAGSIPTAA